MPDFTPYLRDVPDFPKPGIMFKDITPLLGNPVAFKGAIGALADLVRDTRPDCIAAAEARGFLFATPLALELGIGFVPIRKPGKLPYDKIVQSYELEYGTDRLEMHTDAIGAGRRVLLLDDVLATGGTMRACCELIERAGGHVVGCAFFLEIAFLAGRARLEPAYNVLSVVTS